MRGYCRMIIKTPAIVIKTSPYSETSLIASLYTFNEGKIRCIAKGAGRNKSPFAGRIESLNEIEAVYTRGKSELCTLIECSLIQSRMRLRNNFDSLKTGLRIVSLLDETQVEHDPHPSVYNLAITCLNGLETGEEPVSVLIYFQNSLIDALGYATDFDSCAICSSAVGRKPLYSLYKHGFLCPKCAKNRRGVSISDEVILLLKNFRKTGFSSAMKLRFTVSHKKEAIAFLKIMLESFLEYKSATSKILNELE